MSTRWKRNASVDRNVSDVLPTMAAEYFIAGATLAGAVAAPEDLHRFRLKTKHFRYTLELFSTRYGLAFETLLTQLKPVQDALGEINDSAMALEWLQPGERNGVEGYFTERIASQIRGFERYWKTVFDKPGERRRWTEVLSRPGRDPAEHR